MEYVFRGQGHIQAAEGLQPGVLARLGISADVATTEVARIRSEQEARRVAINRLTQDDLNSLPSASEYKGDRGKTATVVQGDAAFMLPSGKTQGLLTFGAGPCAIVVAVATKSGEIVNVGLAHVDAVTPERSIEDFIRSARGSGGADAVKVSIISGESQLALRIDDAVKKAGGTLAFANIDPDGSRDDGVVVDKGGRIYYGSRPDLATVDSEQLRFKSLQRQLPGAELHFQYLN